MVLALMACSCEKSRDPDRHYDESKGFSIKFPKDWEIKRGDGVAAPLVEAVSSWEDDEDLFSEYVSVDVEEFAGDIGLEDMFERTREAQAGEFDHFEIEETGDIKIGSEDAKYMKFIIGMEEGRNRVLSYTLVKGRRGYLIGCVAEEGKFDRYSEIFRETAATFRFE
jgi:hypothetical protein